MLGNCYVFVVEMRHMFWTFLTIFVCSFQALVVFGLMTLKTVFYSWDDGYKIFEMSYMFLDVWAEFLLLNWAMQVIWNWLCWFGFFLQFWIWMLFFCFGYSWRLVEEDGSLGFFSVWQKCSELYIMFSLFCLSLFSVISAFLFDSLWVGWPICTFPTI